MLNGVQIVLACFVGPTFLDDLFAPCLRELETAGHETRRFADAAALRADTEAKAGMAVLVPLSDLRVDAELMDEAPNLRALVSPVTGTEAFDEAAASDRGILVVNGQIEENYKSMAEAAVLLILAALYDLPGAERLLRENLPRPARLKARMLKGKTVGLIGFGQIAQAVAARLSTWEARIIASVRTPRPLPPHVGSVSLDELLSTSDVVVVLSSLTTESRGMLTNERLEQMKDDVVFVNVSRGGIVDDDALAALATRRPAMRLALDVFEPEPLRIDSPLRVLPDAILTPHMIGHTVEMHTQLPLTLRDNVCAVLEGRVPAYVRNPNAVARWMQRFGVLQA
jgi:phosphoglycerate dehydrogenase-like enzyme